MSQPKYAAISESSSGDNTVVAAVSGKRIRVLSYVLIATGAVAVKFVSDASGTDITGAMDLGANGGVSAPHSPSGHYQTGVGEALILNLGAAVQVSGHLTYIEI